MTRSKAHPLIQDLTAIRRAKAISQYKLAAELGCSRSKIEHIERGHTKSPRFDFIMKYAEAVGAQLMVAPVQEETPRAS